MLDPVRIAPWGTPMRPHLFEEPVTVTLSAPLHPGVEIRYTLDGSKPSASSLLYRTPIEVKETTALRVASFRDGRPAGPESEAAFARLSPMPPTPDVAIGDLRPVRTAGFGHSYGGDVRYAGATQSPQKDKSNLGNPLKVNRKTYETGMGVHAPCVLMYELKPEYARWVALAGADENVVSLNNGSNLAMHPSVVFKVFIDGQEAAASPVMRVLSPAWRFDVPIPAGARLISLVAMDAGNGSREDFANWVDAGFMLRK